MRKENMQKLASENDALRKQLNEENKRYYEKLMSYMRLSSFFHDSLEIEELLLEILQDMIDAQSGGVSAADFFGHDAKVAADECLSRVEPRKTEAMKWGSWIFIGSIFLTSLRGLVRPEEGINILSILMQFLLYLTGVSLFFLLDKKINLSEDIYEKEYSDCQCSNNSNYSHSFSGGVNRIFWTKRW